MLLFMKEGRYVHMISYFYNFYYIIIIIIIIKNTSLINTQTYEPCSVWKCCKLGIC